MILETRSEQLLKWLADNLDKARELGITEVGRTDGPAHGDGELGVKFDNGDFVFIVVEQG